MAPWRRRRLSLLHSLAVWALVAIVLLIDRDGCLLATRADVFSWLIGALGFLADAAEFIISGVEMTLSAAVTWLISIVGWLVTKLGDIVLSTGSIFSKTWDALKALWSDVVEPVIWELDSLIERFYRWLSNLLAPIIQWAQDVRTFLLDIYKSFIRPLLNLLNTIKTVLDVLAQLHVPFAQQLDSYVSELETWIQSSYLKLLGEVNKVIDTLNGLFTFDGLLQRFTFLRTAERDVFYLQRVMTNAFTRSLSGSEQETLMRATVTQTVPALNDSIAQYWQGEDNDVGQVIDGLAGDQASIWGSAA